jgi:glutamine synthetase
MKTLPDRQRLFPRAAPGSEASNLLAAAAALRTGDFARARFGDEVLEPYAGLAEWEASKYALAVTDWELERYFEGA